MKIEEIIRDIFKEKGIDNIIISRPPKIEMGDYSVATFNIDYKGIKNPLEKAKALVKDMKSSYFKKIDVMGAYINFYLDYDLFNKEVIKEILNNKNYGSMNQGKNSNMLIEHTSINPNASPHIGRSRNSLLGDFIYRLYSFAGYKVERNYFINDIGKQIAMLVLGVKRENIKKLDFKEMLDLYVRINEEMEKDSSLEEEVFNLLHLLESGDKETIKKFREITDTCIKGQTAIFKSLGIEFDRFTHESDLLFNGDVKTTLEEFKKSGKLREDENGRYYLDLSSYDIPTKSPVLVLTREDKTSLYPLRDIAYTKYKIKRNSVHNLIVLGEDQKVYMKQIEAAMDILGYKSPTLISYSFVLLSGEKMSTRSGKVVLLEDFINETKEKLKLSFKERNLSINEKDLNIITGACIKYAMLGVSKEKNVNFNIDKATEFNGNTGLYILYNIVRINSILNNETLKECTFKYDNLIENDLIKQMADFPRLVDSLLTSFDAASLVNYIYTLTKTFAKYYEEVNIKNIDDDDMKQAKLYLIKSIKIVLTNALNILGIKTVEKM